MSLTHADRLRAVGSGFKGKLVRLVSLGVGRHYEPQRNWRACHQMMQSTVRWVASQLLAAARDEAAKEAEELCASGRCAAALVPLQRAIDFGDFPSRALKAWLHIEGREGVVKNEPTALELAEEGSSFGCHHCQGVMAFCYAEGCGCEIDRARSLELARESSGRGSKYGQLTLALLSLPFGRNWSDGSVPFYELAAAQGLDEAQFRLGQRFYRGVCVVEGLDSRVEALRWFRLAAAQGLHRAIFMVAFCHEHGQGVLENRKKAIRWYRRAQAAGCPRAAGKLRKLGV
jgi:TPR repeat protein